MVVYDTANPYNSLVHDVWDLTSTDSTSLPLDTIIRDFNSKYYDVGMMAWRYSGTWKFNDANDANRPRGTIDLVDLQSSYGLPTNVISIERVEIQNSAGTWNTLKKIDQSVIGMPIKEWEKDSQAGIPMYYDLDGNSIVLYPKPTSADVTLTGGLQLYLGKLVAPFTTSTTTTEPGFNTSYHRILSFYSAMMWFMKQGDNNSAKNMQAMMVDLENKLKDYYSKRQRRKSIRGKHIDYE